MGWRKTDKQKFDGETKRRGPSLSAPEREAERAVFISGGLVNVCFLLRPREKERTCQTRLLKRCFASCASRVGAAGPFFCLVRPLTPCARDVAFMCARWVICAASRARSVRARAKLRRTQPLPAHGSVRLRSRHRPIGPGACTGQPSQTLTLNNHGTNQQTL